MELSLNQAVEYPRDRVGLAGAFQSIDQLDKAPRYLTCATWSWDSQRISVRCRSTESTRERPVKGMGIATLGLIRNHAKMKTWFDRSQAEASGEPMMFRQDRGRVALSKEYLLPMKASPAMLMRSTCTHLSGGRGRYWRQGSGCLESSKRQGSA